jgi:hypothetical protein
MLSDHPRLAPGTGSIKEIDICFCAGNAIRSSSRDPKAHSNRNSPNRFVLASDTTLPAFNSATDASAGPVSGFAESNI